MHPITPALLNVHDCAPELSTGETPRLPVAVCGAGELFGGVERHILDLCRFMRVRRGAPPVLVVFYEGELAMRARASGVPTVVLQGRHRRDPHLPRDLARILSRLGIRLVHAHGYKAMVICALAKRHFAGPDRPRDGDAALVVVKTEHGLLEPADSLGEWWKMHANRTLDWLATYLMADEVCYVTGDLERRLRLLHSGRRGQVIHNGIDPLERSQFPRPVDLEQGLFNLGIVGRVTTVKGISCALKALRTSEAPRAVRLNVIGSGPAEGGLRTLATVLGLQERVRFLGFRSNVYDYMAHLDALVMPSLHEGVPYTLLEAMSLGLPIIATRVGGLPEVLRDGQTGLLVAANDVDGLSRAIREVVARPDWAKVLGARAAEVQRRDYTLDVMGKAYWRVYTRHERFGADPSDK